VLSFLGLRDQERYSQMVLSKDHKYRKCLALGCSHGQIHAPGLRVPKVECDKCRAVSCFGHRVPWHEGESCAAYANRLIDEQENETEAAKRSRLKEEEQRTLKLVKKCPICDTTTTKSSGCDAIYCKYVIRYSTQPQVTTRC
jgi:hypothetical protein